MKNKLNGFLMLALISVSLSTSCGGDDAEPKMELVMKGQTIDISDANLYWAKEAEYNSTHYYRDFAISDGTLTNSSNGGHWYSPNYSGATYLIVIELAIPLGTDFSAGDFIQDASWTVGVSDLKLSWVQAEILGDDYEYLYTEVAQGDPVTASGSWDDNGTLSLSMDADDMWDNVADESGASLKFHFKGVVEKNFYLPAQ